MKKPQTQPKATNPKLKIENLTLDAFIICMEQTGVSLYLPWMLLVIFCRHCRFLSPHIKKIKLVCFGFLVSIEACKIVPYEALVLA